MPEWFDAYSLTNIEERQELQVEGLKESVKYVLEDIEEGDSVGWGCWECVSGRNEYGDGGSDVGNFSLSCFCNRKEEGIRRGARVQRMVSIC